jgi:lipoprotein NlpD
MSLYESKMDHQARLRFGAGAAVSALVAPVALVALVALAGCASQTHRAPVEDRKPAARPSAAQPNVATVNTTPAPVAAVDPQLAKPPPPGVENAGKPGYYTVKAGDTLIRVGLDSGQNWRDISRWNNLENPNVIEVGQVLRVVPPAAEAGSVVVKPVQLAGHVESRPLEGRPPSSAAAPASAPAATTTPPVPAAREGEDDMTWSWPAAGPLAATFDEGKSKGLDIAGKAGDPVLAAADGRVVYAGSGLRGYGNLIIVKHNPTFLTAYAHNQTLLVKEDQVVRRGQKIAEMGSSDADRVQLHFEIRRQGKPVDPARLLPAR